MSEPQQQRIFVDHFLNIESQVAGLVATFQTPPIIIQTASNFVLSVAAGQSTLFSVVRTADKPLGCIAHDPNRLHFFSDDCFVDGVEMLNVEPFTQKFSSFEEMKAFHRDLFTKPFSFKTKVEARRKSDKFLEGNVTYVNKTDVVITVFPRHPDVVTVFTEKLNKAEEAIQEDEKYSVEFQFDSVLRKWFADTLLETTGKEWSPRGASLGYKSSIITTNHSAPVNFCGHIGCRLFAILLCPIWCCACCWYHIYRSRTSNDQTIDFDFSTGTSSQCVV